MVEFRRRREVKIMILMNDDAAIATAIDLAKILCSVQGSGLEVDRQGAEDLANFIEILENRFTGRDTPEN